MVQAIIELKEHENRILNIVKGKYGFKNKSEAINFIISEYEHHFLEPELRPEYFEELKDGQEDKPIMKVKDLKKHF
jgi:hypothetical protein